MTIVQCKECNQEISSSDKICPKCGKDQRNWFKTHKIVTMICVVAIFAITVIIVGSRSSSNNKNKEETKVQNDYDNTVDSTEYHNLNPSYDCLDNWGANIFK